MHNVLLEVRQCAISAAFPCARLIVFLSTLQMQKAMWDHRESKKVVVYSGHDVSLLSVLRTLDADVANDIGYWPDYSSTLALELLENDSGKFFTRVRLNGDILAMSEAPDGHCPSDRFRDVVLDHVG